MKISPKFSSSCLKLDFLLRKIHGGAGLSLVLFVLLDLLEMELLGLILISIDKTHYKC